MTRPKKKPTHGGKRVGAGRPKANTVSRTFRIKSVILDLWAQRNEICGFVSRLDSVDVNFALLRYIEESLRARIDEAPNLTKKERQLLADVHRAYHA